MYCLWDVLPPGNVPVPACSSSACIMVICFTMVLPIGCMENSALVPGIYSTLLPSLCVHSSVSHFFPFLLCILIIHYPFLKMLFQRLHHLGLRARTQVLTSQRCFFRTLIHDKKGNCIPQNIRKKHYGMYKCAKHCILKISLKSASA